MSGFTSALLYLSTFSGALPLALLLIKIKILKPRYFTWLGLLIGGSLITDILTRILIAAQLQQYIGYLINFYTLIQFIFLLLIYIDFYLKQKKIVIGLVATVFLAFETVNSIFFQELKTFQTQTVALTGIISVGLSIGYLKHLFNQRSVLHIAKFAPTWVNLALLFYFSFSFYLFVIAEYVFTKTSTGASIVFWAFHNFNNIIKNCLFAVAIYFGEAKNE